jgi:hypothetical protein
MQGLFTANVALLYDQGWIVDEDQDTEKNVADKKLVSYKDLMAKARATSPRRVRSRAPTPSRRRTGWAAQAITSAQLIASRTRTRRAS